MHLRFVCVAFFAVSGGAQPPRDFSGYTFEQYVLEFGKVYNPEEGAQRRIIFETNLKKVLAHNDEHRAGKHSWFMDMNHLADLTPQEFQRYRSKPGSLVGASRGHLSPSQQLDALNPDRIDWREKGVIGAVRDQGHCGACWAFAATETIESHHAIASGELVQLAPQAFLNCVQNKLDCGGSGGCHGATMELAYNLSITQGLPLEANLPYLKRAQQCQDYSAAVKVGGYVKLPVNSANALETALAGKGPISVIVAAMPWQLYGGGIFKGCSAPLPSLGNELDHGVQVVGYGSESGQSYWLVRNSWGGTWGEKGYIRISRDNDNRTFTDDSPSAGVACKPYPKTQQVGGECGILFDTSYPTGLSVVPSSLTV